MKLRPPFLTAALSCAALPLFADITKPDDDSGGSAQFQLGPISVAVSVDTSESIGKKSAYLGVVTSGLLPQLRAQLDLAEGMGLVVDAVAKDSPAEKAGLRKFDVLKKFNDQMVCTQDQLAVLVKATGTGKKVSLGIIRGGKEQTVEVTLGEHVGPEPGNAHFYINGLPGTSVQLPGLEALDNQFKGGLASGGIQEHLKEQRAEIQKRVDEAIHRAQEAARAGRPGMPGGPKVFSVYPETRTSTSSSSHNVVVLTDNEGTVEVTDADGQKTVKIKDAGGQVIYDAALNSDIDRGGVPEKYRVKVKEAEDRIKANTALPKKAPRKLQTLPPQPQLQPVPVPVPPPAPPAPPAPLPPTSKPDKGSI